MFRFITDLLFGRENDSAALGSASINNAALGSAGNSLTGNYFEYPSAEYLARQQEAFRVIAERQYLITTGAYLGQTAGRVALADALVQQGIIPSTSEYFNFLNGTPAKEKEVIKYRRYK